MRRSVGSLIDLLTTMHADSPEVAKRQALGLNEAKPRIALVNATRNVAYLFRITRLERAFPICRDVPSALAVVEGRDGDDEKPEANGLLRALGF